jgi:hypothetical protein
MGWDRGFGFGGSGEGGGEGLVVWWFHGTLVKECGCVGRYCK